MKQLLSLIVSLLILSAPISSAAGGLQMSAEASRFDCPNDPSVVACYKGIVDHSNNLLDFTENLLTDRTEFNDWTQTGTCAVTADQWRNPVNGTMDADYLDNTGGANTDNRSRSTTPGGALGGRTFTYSVWIRADYNHTCSIGVWETGIGWLVGPTDVGVTGTWHRFNISGTCTGGGAGTLIAYAYPGESGVATGTAYFYGAQLIENDEWRTGPGIFINPTDQSTTKPRHDLAPTNAPTAAKAHLQGAGGNKLEAREFNGTSQSYGKAHHANMNVFDSNHTVTKHFLGNSSTIAAWDRLIAHGVLNTDGFELMVNASFYVVAYYNSAASGVAVPCPTTAVNDNMYHTVQIVRNGNNAVCRLDGVAGASTDVTGRGIDANRNLRIAAGDGGGNQYGGQISYTRLDAKALSTDELAAEREMILGTETNWSDSNAWTFERSTTAYKTFSNRYENTYPSHSMDLVAVNTPRVSGQGGGLLIEGETTQLHGLTEDFSGWAETGTCAVTANNYVAPNGTVTADTLDNTGGVNTDRRSLTTANLGTLTGRTLVGSVWMRTDTPHLCTIRTYEAGVAELSSSDVWVTQEWQRFYTTGTCAGGGTGEITYQIHPGQRGVATGIAEFWGANLTETTFATSYIPNAGAATSQVTRTADDITFDPHPAGTTEIVIPETFCATCAASKLTVYGEWKAEWSGAADIGATRRFISIGNAASANNRVEMYATANGRLWLIFQNDGGTSRNIYTAIDVVDYSEWFSFRAIIDFMDLSRSDIYINGVVSHDGDSGNWTGGATLDTSGNTIRLGANRLGVVDGYNWVENLRITSTEVRP